MKESDRCEVGDWGYGADCDCPCGRARSAPAGGALHDAAPFYFHSPDPSHVYALHSDVDLPRGQDAGGDSLLGLRGHSPHVLGVHIPSDPSKIPSLGA